MTCPHDTIRGVDVSSLTLMQRRLFERLNYSTSISADDLASRLRSTNKSVINQVRAIRQKLGANIITTTADGYRLRKQEE